MLCVLWRCSCSRASHRSAGPPAPAICPPGRPNGPGSGRTVAHLPARSSEWAGLGRGPGCICPPGRPSGLGRCGPADPFARPVVRVGPVWARPVAFARPVVRVWLAWVRTRLHSPHRAGKWRVSGPFVRSFGLPGGRVAGQRPHLTPAAHPRPTRPGRRPRRVNGRHDRAPGGGGLSSGPRCLPCRRDGGDGSSIAGGVE